MARIGDGGDSTSAGGDGAPQPKAPSGPQVPYAKDPAAQGRIRVTVTVDGQVLWCSSLFHDVGLTTIARNTMCFEIEGAEFARRTLERFGMDPAAADRAAITWL